MRTVYLRMLISVTLYATLSVAAPCFAQNGPSHGRYVYHEDPETGAKIALSRSDLPINYLIVGDLGQGSEYLVGPLYYLLADAAGLKVDRDKKSYSLLVIHDRNVFDKLRSNRASFSSLGLTDETIDLFQSKVTDQTRCLFGNFPTDQKEKHELSVTVVLSSEPYDTCLPQNVLRSFGIVADYADFDAIVSTCVLYEGKRANIRELQKLRDERERLASQCLKRVGAVWPPGPQTPQDPK